MPDTEALVGIGTVLGSMVWFLFQQSKRWRNFKAITQELEKRADDLEAQMQAQKLRYIEQRANDQEAIESRDKTLLIYQDQLRTSLVEQQKIMSELNICQNNGHKLADKLESSEKKNGELVDENGKLKHWQDKIPEYEKRIASLEKHNAELTEQFKEQRAYDKGQLSGALLAIEKMGVKVRERIDLEEVAESIEANHKDKPTPLK